MYIITNNSQKNNYDTLILIEGVGDLYELFEYNLPNPNHYYRNNDKYHIEYYIDGYFFTRKGIDYLNDILSRFLLTFQNITYQTAKTVKKKDNVYHLKDFQNLNSIEKEIYIPNHNKYEDSVFWSLKLYVEYMLKNDHEFILFQTLEHYAFSHFVDYVKDNSTLRSKCRSIWKWYDERGWKPTLRLKSNKSKKEIEMTRRENMIKVRKQHADKTKKKVINAITGLFSENYKKKNGKWNISKLSNDLNVSRNSVYKYIEEYEREIIID